MEFIDKILGRNHHDDLDMDGGDPFSKESGLSLPDLNNPGSNDPLEKTGDPMNLNDQTGQAQTGLPNEASNLNFNNPDLNAQTNTPKPDPYKTGMSIQQQMVPQQPIQATTAPDNKDIQIIIAKLDAIKAELDSLQQRVQKIEKIAEADQAAAQSHTTPNYGRW